MEHLGGSPAGGDDGTDVIKSELIFTQFSEDFVIDLVNFGIAMVWVSARTSMSFLSGDSTTV